MEVFDLDPVAAFIMLGMVAGVVELVKRLFDAIKNKDTEALRAVFIIAGAGVAGALTALLLAINPLIGAVVGFAASGYVTIAQNIGDNY